MMRRDDLLDLLFDLKHDLVKYVRLPFVMLSPDASPADLRAALESALLKTRTGPAGTRTARQIWQDFLDGSEGQLEAFNQYDRLVSSVEKILAWENILSSGDTRIDRENLAKDLDELSLSVKQLIEEVGLAS